MPRITFEEIDRITKEVLDDEFRTTFTTTASTWDSIDSEGLLDELKRLIHRIEYNRRFKQIKRSPFFSTYYGCILTRPSAISVVGVGA